MQPKPLFEKIDNQTVESLRSRFSGQKKTPPVKDSKKNKNAGSNGPPAKDSPQGGGSGGETPVDSAMAEKLQAQVTSQVRFTLNSSVFWRQGTGEFGPVFERDFCACFMVCFHGDKELAFISALVLVLFLKTRL